MDLHRTKEGFALYKEKTQIGFCTLTPAPKGAAIAALCIQPQWRRKGYGSYFLKEILRSFAGYDREQATVFTAPLPADAAKPNLAQNASSAASAGSGAVNTVACSRSYPAKLRKISFRK